MAYSQFRVGGHYTVFLYKNKTLAYVQMVTERAPQPVAQPQPIQPLDQQYPIEIALPAALQAGYLEIMFLEQWNQEVWAQLGFNNASDLLDVFNQQLASGELTLVKQIKNPNPNGTSRQITYTGCVVVNAQIDETIQIGTMTVPKTMTIMYRKRTELIQ